MAEKTRAGIYVRVSTEDQRDNGYSIDSQIRMCKEYCEKNNYSIVDIYNDAGFSGKNLNRPNMERLLKDIKLRKLDKLVAIKTDRLTRSNLDGLKFLQVCQENDVKIELILEPYDINTANGEMMYGMNLVFGQRERKEIGARTKRALEEMAKEKVHPAKAPFGYVRDKETGHLEINQLEAESVKRAFELVKEGHSCKKTAEILKEENAYNGNSKWLASRVVNILNNSIYIGRYEYGKRTRKKDDILVVDNYCEPIIDMDTWNITRRKLQKHKHIDYGTHVHIFTGLVKCPICNEIMASSLSYKERASGKKIYYHLRCQNKNCKGYDYHYNCDKIETTLKNVLNELIVYIFDDKNKIIVPDKNINEELKVINKNIESLERQQEKLVDLYVSSDINVEVLNKKNDKLKKDIVTAIERRQKLNPNNINDEFYINLSKLYDVDYDNNKFKFKNNLVFPLGWDSLTKEAKRDLLNMMISSIEIERDDSFNIKIKKITFTDEFLKKTKPEFINYIYELVSNYKMGFRYESSIYVNDLDKIKEEYDLFSLIKLAKNNYSKEEVENYFGKARDHFYRDGISVRALIDNNKIIDELLLIPKKFSEA